MTSLASCRTLRFPEAPAPALQFCHERFLDTRALPRPVRDLPYVLMRKMEASCNGGDDTPGSRRGGKLGPKRDTIHGGNQPLSERERYRRGDIQVKRKIAAAMHTRDLPARIRALRKSLGMNQKEFGVECGVGQVAVSQWENEKNPAIPTSKALFRMSELATLADRQWWRDCAAEQSGVDIAVPSNTSEPFNLPALVTRIPLIQDPQKVGTNVGSVTVADVERILYFSSDLVPEGGKLEAVRVTSTTCDLVAVVDVSRQDAERLVGKMVAVRTIDGIEVRWLTKEDGVMLLMPFQPGQNVKALRYKGEWSIAGAIRWLGDAPAPEKTQQHSNKRRH